MFRFCIADTEHDWREGSEQYKFIEHCLATVDRQKQPWLIFAAHRVLGYSSSSGYASEGSFEEPMGRESLQILWQKYKVDIAFYGHVHQYERTCPIYQVRTIIKYAIILFTFEITCIVPKSMIEATMQVASNVNMDGCSFILHNLL
jgi:hypothetical protein